MGRDGVRLGPPWRRALAAALLLHAGLLVALMLLGRTVPPASPFLTVELQLTQAEDEVTPPLQLAAVEPVPIVTSPADPSRAPSAPAPADLPPSEVQDAPPPEPPAARTMPVVAPALVPTVLPSVQTPSERASEPPDDSPIPKPEAAPPPPAAKAISTQPPTAASVSPLRQVQPRPQASASQPRRALSSSHEAAPTQPVPAPAPSAQSVAESPHDPAAEAAWRSALASWVERHLSYPDEARRRGDQGVALVRVELDSSGKVVAVTLARGSGVATLDEAATALVRGATLPTPPGTAPRAVTLALRYRLQ